MPTDSSRNSFRVLSLEAEAATPDWRRFLCCGDRGAVKCCCKCCTTHEERVSREFADLDEDSDKKILSILGRFNELSYDMNEIGELQQSSDISRKLKIVHQIIADMGWKKCRRALYYAASAVLRVGGIVLSAYTAYVANTEPDSSVLPKISLAATLAIATGVFFRELVDKVDGDIKIAAQIAARADEEVDIESALARLEGTRTWRAMHRGNEIGVVINL